MASQGLETTAAEESPAGSDGVPEGSDGRCLMQALTARRIAFRCLRDEITNPKSRRPVMAFSIKGVTYYFDGCLRGGSSSLVPGSRSMARLPMTSSKIRV